MSGPRRTSVLVLGGGPDAERAVSLRSAACVAGALRESGRYEVIERTVDRLSAEELAGMAGDVVFPVLHGSWGEGGPLQDLLECCGRAFVGSGSAASRLAMDKMATKLMAASIGVSTKPGFVLNRRDPVCPTGFPVVVKPIHDGSSCGLHLCDDARAWGRAMEAVLGEAATGEPAAYMVEERIAGRELTVGLLDGAALPTIEIVPADGVYDYEAKYHRDDTRYVVGPDLPRGVGEELVRASERLAREMGLRHMGRADFMLDGDGTAWLLEVNTIPGFTDHSLVPMAARAAGMEMPALCDRLVGLALRDGAMLCTGQGSGAGRVWH